MYSLHLFRVDSVYCRSQDACREHINIIPKLKEWSELASKCRLKLLSEVSHCQHLWNCSLDQEFGRNAKLMEILLSWRGWDWRWETKSWANSLAMESQWETNQSSGLWRGNTQWSLFNWRSPPVPTASPTTPPRLSWLGFLDDSEYFRLIMIGQTPEQCRGKLSDDQTQGPVLDHSTLISLKVSAVSWVRMSRVFLEFECWKLEFWVH